MRRRAIEWPYWPQIIGGARTWLHAFGIYPRRPQIRSRVATTARNVLR